MTTSHFIFLEKIILGIPQQHTYVNRKKQSTLMASIDKETENYDRTSSNLRYGKVFPRHLNPNYNQKESIKQHFTEYSYNYVYIFIATECHEQILTEPVDNNDPFGEMEFAQEVCATLNSTFEEILNDCPEFKTATSIGKSVGSFRVVIKSLYFYFQLKETMSLRN